MSGHSKWSTIKRAKGAADAKRGKLFTKLAREIQVSARIGGGDPKNNSRLRDAMAEARANNMPKDNIERAIKSGTGDLQGVSFEQIVYEGYGPGGVAMLIESLTDNRNRTVADLRALMTRNGGSIADAGSVAWIFSKKGLIQIGRKMAPEEKLMELALDAGAEDVIDAGEVWDIVTDPLAFSAVQEAIRTSGIPVESAGLTAIPKTTVKLAGEDAARMIRLVDLIEELDDVQRVFSNSDIDEQELKKYLL